MLLDTAHRIPKLSHLQDTVPKDVLVSMHLYYIKEHLLRAASSNHFIPALYANIALYQDLSAATSQKEFLPINATPREHNLIYWKGFPTKLLIMYQNQHLVITSPKDGY